MNLLSLLPLSWRLGLFAAAVAAVIGGYVFWRGHVFNEGWRAAINAVAARDRKAIEAVDRALQALRSCQDAGREWDQVNGMCREGTE